jgi:FkbM family methyltransferase
MTDYSQFNEQAAILAAFPEGIGRFLDIGAWHPTDKSNTRALYEIRWSGVMIEPSPGPMKSLLAAYGNDERVTLVQAAVSLDTAPLVRLHVTDDAVTTSSEAEYEKWKEAGGFLGSLMVPCITLTQIAQQFGGFDFWSIDAEGLSADLFLQALTLGMLPTCVCVEFDNRLAEISAAATKEHYVMTFSNSTNAVFVRK